MKMVKDADLSPDESYIFAFHPHGILAFGAWCGFATNGLGFDSLFPGIRVAALTLINNLR